MLSVINCVVPLDTAGVYGMIIAKARVITMKLNKNYLVHIEDGTTLLVPTAEAEFSGIIRGNKTLAAILALLQEEIDRDEIVRRLGERFEADDGVIEADVCATLNKLIEIGAVDE